MASEGISPAIKTESSVVSGQPAEMQVTGPSKVARKTQSNLNCKYMKEPNSYKHHGTMNHSFSFFYSFMMVYVAIFKGQFDWPPMTFSFSSDELVVGSHFAPAFSCDS